ncbi:hypothetical protein LEP1GSC062_1155 [Leptospira alexanderi serovar Manhao 3 str. L 60]|uniref:Uncharacterized protein n=1 Tax=Leptospira alexanderi serovar Manhao 3 str. L 60 TaxID=1049759 RepID=V6IEP4_9LEPT|nr:hypothetical protein LEP1GSC062_1155 [Leptospira alexanderi serovar Manhao 3 str. L 60]
MNEIDSDRSFFPTFIKRILPDFVVNFKNHERKFPSKRIPNFHSCKW